MQKWVNLQGYLRFHYLFFTTSILHVKVFQVKYIETQKFMLLVNLMVLDHFDANIFKWSHKSTIFGHWSLYATTLFKMRPLYATTLCDHFIGHFI